MLKTILTRIAKWLFAKTIKASAVSSVIFLLATNLGETLRALARKLNLMQKMQQLSSLTTWRAKKLVSLQSNTKHLHSSESSKRVQIHLYSMMV